MATHSCIFAQRTPWTEKHGRLQSMGLQRVGYDWAANTYFVVRSLTCVRLFSTPWTEAHQASLSFIFSQRLLKLMSIKSVMPFNHLVLCHPLLLLPSIFSTIRVFSNELVVCIRWPKYWSWSWSFSISPSNEYSGLISFRIAGLIFLQSKGLSRVFSNTTVT